MPRVVPPSRLSPFRIFRFLAYSWLLRACRCALPPRARDTAETSVLGASIRWALADRLAKDEDSTSKLVLRRASTSQFYFFFLFFALNFAHRAFCAAAIRARAAGER